MIAAPIDVERDIQIKTSIAGNHGSTCPVKRDAKYQWNYQALSHTTCYTLAIFMGNLSHGDLITAEDIEYSIKFRYVESYS